MERKNIFVKLFLVFVVVGMFIGLSGCSKEEKAVNMTGSYSSTSNISFFSAYPNYTYKQASFSVQNLKTYSDNTYVLVSTTTLFSGALLFNDDGTYETVPRGNVVTYYYGSYEQEGEDGLLTITLSTPNRVVLDNHNSIATTGYAVDTDNWTDQIGTNVAGEGEEPLSANEYLSSVAFQEIEILINEANADFTYAQLIPQA